MCAMWKIQYSDIIQGWVVPGAVLNGVSTTFALKGYLPMGNWPHYYSFSKLVFCNVLTTSINNTHIKRKNSKTICSSRETISSRIFGSAPNSPNTRCHLCDLVCLTSLWHSHRRVHSAGWPSPFWTQQISWHVCLTRYLGNAMQCPFSISALGTVYDAAQNNLWRCEPNITSVVHVVKYETLCRRDWLLIGNFLIPRN
jgi:hypothetical protein